MNQNDKIRQIKNANYNQKPLNIQQWVNPFLLLSNNQALNKLLMKKTKK